MEKLDNKDKDTITAEVSEYAKPKMKPTKYFICAVVGLLALIGISNDDNVENSPISTASVVSATSGTGGVPASSIQYREVEIVRGDIVVGVTEAGAATMNTTSVSFDFDCAIDEVLVKAGQFVHEGDVVAMVNLDDIRQEYYDQFDSLSSSLASAQISLQSTLINAETSKIQAAKTLNTALTNGENATDVHNYNISSINTEYEGLVDDLAELYNDLELAIDDLDSGYVYSYDIVDMRAEMYEMVIELSDLNKQMSHANACSGIHSGTCTQPEWSHDYTSLKSEYDTLSYAKARLSSELDIEYAKYDSDVEKLYDAVDNVKSSITKKEDEILSYNLSKDIKILNAITDNQETLFSYEYAEIEYENTIAKIDNDVASAQLNVDNIISDINSISLALDNGTITAPANGFVMSVATAGEDLRSESALISIADRDVINVLVSISQDDIATIQVGADAQVTFDAYDDYIIPSVVDSINITSSGMTVNYTVTIVCDITDIPELTIYQGMTCDVTFIQRQVNDVLTVSNKCVTSENGKQYVKVLKDGEIYQTEIVTGFSDGFDVEIISGVNEGDIVILESVVNY